MEDLGIEFGDVRWGIKEEGGIEIRCVAEVDWVCEMESGD